MISTNLTKEDYTLILDVLGKILDNRAKLPEYSIQEIEQVYTKLYFENYWQQNDQKTPDCRRYSWELPGT